MISSQRSTVDPTMISEENLGGYHRFCLEKPYHLDYVSDSLYDLLGYTAVEIHHLFHDKYSQMVYMKDRKKFLGFIEQLATKEQTLTLQYHIVHKDGHLIYLDDMITSRRLQDGRMYGFAVIADITDSQQPQDLGILPPHIRKSWQLPAVFCNVPAKSILKLPTLTRACWNISA